MGEQLYSELKWFLDNLELQIDDIILDREGVAVDLYWDTADVRDAVLGMAAYYDKGMFSPEAFDDRTALVRSLLSAGWLGPVRMLHPHQAEFLNLIDLEFGIGPTGPPSGGVQQFLLDIGFRVRL
jgi:hypothetical protein